MVPVIIGGAVQILDIILKYTAKNPDTAPQFAGVVGGLIGAVSQAAGETAEETAARIAAHDALVAAYSAGPPPGAKLEG